MSQELSKVEEVSIKKMLANNIKAIKTVLPKHMTPERMMRIAFTAISRSPGLARCTPISLLNAVIEASMLGLEVNSPLGQASMVPFWNGKSQKLEAQLIPEYKGKIELAYRSGMVRSFQAHPVFSEDQFSYQYGLNPTLLHIPSKKEDRGKLIAAYAVVNYINGGFDFEVIEEGEAMAAKAKSASARQDEKNKTSLSLWNSEDEPAMWVKTAVHRLFKRVPKSPEYIQIARAQELSTKAELGEPQDFDYLDAEITELPSPEAKKEKTGISNGKPSQPGAPTGGLPEQEYPIEGELPHPGKKEEKKQREEGGPPVPVEAPRDLEHTPKPAPGQSKTEASPQPPVKEKPKEEKPKETYMKQVMALFKSKPKAYYEAAREAQVDECNTEAAALLILNKATEISERRKKK